MSEIGELVFCCCGHSQPSFDLLESPPLLRTEAAIVAHLLEAMRQDVL